MDLEIRAIAPHEVLEFRRTLSEGFGDDPADDDTTRFTEQVDLSRTYAAFEDGDMIGTAAAYTFEVTVPGGLVPMGGLTMVTVRPTHRRSGVLTAMMQAHFDDVVGRDEPLSGLWASETPIYGRFGFGDAIPRLDLAIDASRARIEPTPRDEVRIVDEEVAKKHIPELYERHRSDRPGMLSRSEPWWRHRRFFDPEWIREGASARRYALARRAGEPVGYATYRQKEKWEDDLPNGAVSIIEIVGDQAATVSLWRFLTAIDLFPQVTWWNAPVDDPVRWMAANSRAVKTVVRDSLWVRLMDVTRCMEARKYRRPGSLRIGVSDVMFPENAATYLLVVDEDGDAMCHQTTDEADVEMDVATLGALYMGGRRTAPMAAAGLIRGEDDAVTLLDELVGWDTAWCPEVF